MENFRDKPISNPSPSDHKLDVLTTTPLAPWQIWGQQHTSSIVSRKLYTLEFVVQCGALTV